MISSVTRTVGFESRAARVPEDMYTAEEIAELFNLLFDVKHDEAV